MQNHDAVSLLRRVQIRATKKKAAILNALACSTRPVDAYSIHHRVSSRLPTDLATVYRTLALFKEKGIIRDVIDDSGVQFFELKSSAQPLHAHFRCARCRKYYCLPEFNYEETDFISSFAEDFDVREISVTLSGVCPNCQQEQP